MIPANAKRYIDSFEVKTNTKYNYYLQGYSNISTSDSVTVTAFLRFTAPNGFSLTGDSYATGFVLKWQDNTKLESAYRVDIKTPDQADFTVLQTLPANATSCQLNNLDSTKTYQLRIAGITSNNNMVYSITVTISKGKLNTKPLAIIPDNKGPKRS